MLRLEQKRGQRRIRDVTVGVGERELHRLDPAVQRVGQLLEQAERDQRGGALAVRRQLADLDAAIGEYRSGSTHSEA